jgi:D-3-phosphoglycerate dehydrogenase
MGDFKVALVSWGRELIPTWLSEELAKKGISFIAQECETSDELAACASDADVVWVFGGGKCLTADRLSLLKRCGAIIRSGSGTDNVPVREATNQRILVANTPDATTDAVSDHAIGLLLAIVRQITVQDRAVRSGIWDREHAWPGWHFPGSTLGTIGFGQVARAMARKMKGFGVKTIACDPGVGEALMAPLNVTKVKLDDLLRTSDFVSIHCPLNRDTYHLIAEMELRSMKPSAVLINTARGQVVDEAALVRALKEGWIAAAGLDVLEKEPPAPSNPLLVLPNVVLTPHSGGDSDVFRELMWKLSYETVVDLHCNRWPRSCVNPEIEPRWHLV